MSEPITMEYFTEIMEKVDAVHKALEEFTPPEALDVLKIVRSNLRAEIRVSTVVENLNGGGLWR